MPGSASARRHSAPRARHDLADPGVLPVPYGLGPLAVRLRRPFVRQQDEHRACRRLQGVRTGRRGGLLDPDHQRQYELGCGVPLRAAVPEGAVRDGGRIAEAVAGAVVAVGAGHSSSLPDRPEAPAVASWRTG